MAIRTEILDTSDGNLFAGPTSMRFTTRELDYLALAGRGFRHKEIGCELGVTTGYVHTRIESLINRLGFFSDTQTVTYAVSSGQIPKEEVFKGFPPDELLLRPSEKLLTARQIELLPIIAIGASRYPGLELAVQSNTVRAIGYNVRVGWGLNSTTQVILTAIERGYLGLDDVIKVRKAEKLRKLVGWEELSDLDRKLVSKIFSGEQQKTLSGRVGLPRSTVRTRMALLRRKVGVQNNFQLGLKFMESGHIEPSDVVGRVDLSRFGDLTSEEYSVLNSLIVDRGVNFYREKEIASFLGKKVRRIRLVRSRITEKVGLTTMEQAAFFYIEAIRYGYLKSRRVGAPNLGKVMEWPNDA